MKKLTKYATLTTTAAGIIHLVNKSIFSLSLLKNILDKKQGYYYEWKFGEVFYTKQGSGQPLLLIHDLDTRSCSYEWIETVNRLAENYTVYTIDLLGCGRSDKPILTYTNYLYVQLISDFTKSIIAEKTDVIVSGLSSSFVIMASLNDKSLFNRIIMVNPVSPKKLDKTLNICSKFQRSLINVPILGTLIYNLATSKNNIKTKYNGLLNKYADAFCEAAHIGGFRSKYLYSCITGNYLTANVTHALKQISNSMFIIYSGTEKNKESINDYKAINPTIEAAYLKDKCNLPHINRPLHFIKQIKQFLQ